MTLQEQREQHNKTVMETLEIGDLVEFNRGMYSHWAVYLGDMKVIHLVGDGNDGFNADINSGHLFTISGKRFKKAFVKVDDIRDVVGDSYIDKNNYKDKRMTPDDPEEIIKRAMDMIGEVGYNILWNNCEHFAAFCRYGIPWSDQVDTLLRWFLNFVSSLVYVAICLGDASKREM